MLLLVFLTQVGLASATCYFALNSTVNFEVLKGPLNYTAQAACEDSCTQMAACSGIAIARKGDVFSCSLLGKPIIDKTCRRPTLIFKRNENYCPIVFRGVLLPETALCDSTTCKCPVDKYIRIGVGEGVADYYVSASSLRWSDASGWNADNAGGSGFRIGKDSKIFSVSCKKIDSAFKENGCQLPTVYNGHFGPSGVVCPGGLERVSFFDGQDLKSSKDAQLLSCGPINGFTYNGKKVTVTNVRCT